MNGATLIRVWLTVFITDFVWFWNLKSLSIILPRSFCSASACKVFLPNLIGSLAVSLFLIKYWPFPGFRTLSFSWNRTCISLKFFFTIVLASLKLSSIEYNELLSAKLQVYGSCIKWKMSLMKILNKRGPIIDRRGAARLILYHSLKLLFTLTVWNHFQK